VENKHTHEDKQSYTSSYVEDVLTVELLCGTRGRRKKKRMTEHQPHLKQNICAGRGNKDVY
jgi:hypothetical protein